MVKIGAGRENMMCYSVPFVYVQMYSILFVSCQLLSGHIRTVRGFHM